MQNWGIPRRYLLLLHSIGASRTGLFGFCLVSVLALMAIFAPWIAPYEPTQVDMLNRLQPPSWSHWMGTDLTGRDVFSRLIWGARPSLQVGILAVLIGLPGGFAVGLLAGFYRGTMLETILMRIVEIIAAVPLLIVAIAVVGVLGVKPIAMGPFTITNEIKIVVVLGFLYIIPTTYLLSENSCSENIIMLYCTSCARQ